jgi:hypothetical protein
VFTFPILTIIRRSSRTEDSRRFLVGVRKVLLWEKTRGGGEARGVVPVADEVKAEALQCEGEFSQAVFFAGADGNSSTLPRWTGGTHFTFGRKFAGM